jgi:excisionase family DNA binding protein
MSARTKRQVPRVTLTREEAAEALGMSVDHLERHVLRDLRVIRSGRLVLISVRELEAWADRNAELLLGRER